MQRSGRPLLYSPQFVAGFASALREARTDLHEMRLRHLCELAELQGEVAALREVVLMVIGILSQQTEVDLAKLQRELETVFARFERDPARRLH
jgi:hypothetical protein